MSTDCAQQNDVFAAAAADDHHRRVRGFGFWRHEVAKIENHVAESPVPIVWFAENWGDVFYNGLMGRGTWVVAELGREGSPRLTVLGGGEG